MQKVKDDQQQLKIESMSNKTVNRVNLIVDKGKDKEI